MAHLVACIFAGVMAQLLEFQFCKTKVFWFLHQMLFKTLAYTSSVQCSYQTALSAVSSQQSAASSIITTRTREATAGN